jgi:hypothetical protein
VPVNPFYAVNYEIADSHTKLTPTMSLVYPERKWIKERMHHKEKRSLNRVKQILILAGTTPGESRIYADQAKNYCRATQDPQNRLRIFQHENSSNQMAIRAKCE